MKLEDLISLIVSVLNLITALIAYETIKQTKKSPTKKSNSKKKKRK